MAGSVNKVILIGNLGADPQVRHTENNQTVANLRIATNRRYKDKNGERVEHTEWHSVVMWGKLAEIADSYLSKGKTVYIEGRLQTRKWQDQSGNDRYTTEIVAENMMMLNSKRVEEDSVNDPHESSIAEEPDKEINSQPESPAASGVEEADDLPF